MPFKSEKQRRYLWATNPKLAKKVDGEVRVSNTDEVQKSNRLLSKLPKNPEPEVKKVEQESKRS